MVVTGGEGSCGGDTRSFTGNRPCRRDAGRHGPKGNAHALAHARTRRTQCRAPSMKQKENTSAVHTECVAQRRAWTKGRRCCLECAKLFFPRTYTGTFTAFCVGNRVSRMMTFFPPVVFRTYPRTPQYVQSRPTRITRTCALSIVQYFVNLTKIINILARGVQQPNNIIFLH